MRHPLRIASLRLIRPTPATRPTTQSGFALTNLRATAPSPDQKKLRLSIVVAGQVHYTEVALVSGAMNVQYRSLQGDTAKYL